MPCEAVERCIPPGGGLLQHATADSAIPVALFNNIAEMSLRDIAYVVARLVSGNEIPAGEIKQTVDYAFAADAPWCTSEATAMLSNFSTALLSPSRITARFVARLLAAADRQAGRQRRTVLA